MGLKVLAEDSKRQRVISDLDILLRASQIRHDEARMNAIGDYLDGCRDVIMPRSSL
jgi:hypothetical protein